MESEKCHTFLEMSKAATVLATWDIKSLSAGSEEVMRAVHTLVEFSWTFCNSMCKKYSEELEKGMDTVIGHDG